MWEEVDLTNHIDVEGVHEMTDNQPEQKNMKKFVLFHKLPPTSWLELSSSWWSSSRHADNTIPLILSLSLSLSLYSSLLAIALGKFSKQHLVSAQS